MQCLNGVETMLVSQPAIRTLSRVGLMDRVHSETAARKVLEKLVDPEDLWAFQSLLTQHGEDICQSKSPRCGDCAIVSLCKFKRKVGIAGAGA
jgi:endonuclease III